MIFITIAAFFTPIKGLLFTTGAMILADFFTGMYAAYKRREKIESRKMQNTITKLILYTGAIILAQLMQNNFIHDVPVSKITGSIVCMVEFKSILENIRSITGIDIFGALKNKLNARKE